MIFNMELPDQLFYNRNALVMILQQKYIVNDFTPDMIYKSFTIGMNCKWFYNRYGQEMILIQKCNVNDFTIKNTLELTLQQKYIVNDFYNRNEF